MPTYCAAAGEILHVPEIGPRLRRLAALERIRAIGQHRAIDIGADTIIILVLRRNIGNDGVGIQAMLLKIFLLARRQDKNCGMADLGRSEEHTSELQSLMRISYAVFC